MPGEVIHREINGSNVLPHHVVPEKALHLTVFVPHEVQVGEMAVLIEVGLSHEPGVYPVEDATVSKGVSVEFKVLDELRHVGAVGSFHISSVGT